MVGIQQSVLIHFAARDEISAPIGIMSGALAGLSIMAMKMASDFNIAMARVDSLMPESKKQLAGLNDEVLKLSKSMGVDAVGAADALYEAISAGVPKDNAIAFLGVATKAAIAGVTDTKTAVDGMTSAMNAFRIPFAQTEKTANEMFMAVNLGKMTFGELSDAMGVASSMAAVTGVNFNEMLAAATTMTKQGITVSQAMTQIRSELTGLNKPSQNLKKIFEDLGVVTGKELVEKFGGFQKATEAISASAERLGMTQASVFGRIEATKGMLMLTGQQAGMANDDLLALQNTTNQLGKAFTDIDDTPARRWARAITEFKDAMISAGNTSLPIFEGLAKAVSSTVVVFDALPSGVKATTLSVGLFVGTLGLALTAGIRFNEVLKALNTAFHVQDGAAKGNVSTMGKVAAGFGIVAIAFTALEAALRFKTGKGILEHLMGDGGAERAKRDLQEVQDKVAMIDKIWKLGSQANKDERWKASLVGADEVLAALNRYNAAFDTLSAKRKKIVEGDGVWGAIGKVADIGPSWMQLDSINKAGDAWEDYVATLNKQFELIGMLFGTSSEEYQNWVTALKSETPEEVWKRISEGSGAAAKGIKIYLDNLKNAEAFMKDPTNKADAAFKSAEESADSYFKKLEEGQKAIDAVRNSYDKLIDSLGQSTPLFQASTLQIALNNLEIAKIEEAARDAAGVTRELTSAESARIKQLKSDNESLGRHTELTKAQSEVLKALTSDTSNYVSKMDSGSKSASTWALQLHEIASEVSKNAGSAPEAIKQMSLINNVIQNMAKEPDKAIAALAQLRNTLGNDSPAWQAIARKFDAAFWQTLLEGISDPNKRAATQAGLEHALSINLTPIGAYTASTYGAGLINGLNGVVAWAVGYMRQVQDKVSRAWLAPGEQGPMTDEQRAALALQNPDIPIVTAGAPNLGGGGAFGSGSGGGGAAEKVKTAVDGFIKAYEDAVRARVLKMQFGDIGGTLVDNLVKSLTDNSEGAGQAVAKSLDDVLAKLKEIRPEWEATEWGNALAGAVRAAIDNKTPETIQAVEDLLTGMSKAIKDHDLGVAAADKLGSAIIHALKNKYTAERDFQIKLEEENISNQEKYKQAELTILSDSKDKALALLDEEKTATSKKFDKEKQDAEDAATTRKRLMDDTHMYAIRAIEDTLKAEEDAIDAKIALVKAGIEAENRVNNEIDHTDRMGQLQNDYARAKSAAERARIQKEIDKETRNHEAGLHKDAADDYVQKLQDQLKALKDSADAQKRIANDAYEDAQRKEEDYTKAVMRGIQDRLDVANAGYEKRKKDLEAQYKADVKYVTDYYDKYIATLKAQEEKDKLYWENKLSETNLNNEALLLLMKGNQDDIMNLFIQYYPEWQTAGMSLGDRLINGVRESAMGGLATLIGEITAAMGSLGSPGGSSPGSGIGAGSGGGRTYTVQEGDTLSAIAAMLGIDMDTLYAMNSGTIGPNPNLIYPGEVLNYAGGTLGARAGFSFVGETGPELRFNSSGTSINSTSRTKEMIMDAVREAVGSGGGDQPHIVQVYIGKEKIEEMVVKGYSNASRKTY